MAGMMKLKIVLSAIVLAACGDNIVPPRPDSPPTHQAEEPPIDPGGCVAIDWNQTCPGPDASEPPPVDAPVDATTEVDAGCDDQELKAACCHALENGQPPMHECGYPPGICHSGRHDLHCGELTFDLCNP